jgi:hypothetical protein
VSAIRSAGTGTAAQNIDKVVKSYASGAFKGAKTGIKAVSRGRFVTPVSSSAPVTPASPPVTPASAPATPAGGVRALPSPDDIGSTTGRAASTTGRAASATGQAASATGQAASATGQAASATGKVASATGKVASASGKVALSAGKAVGKGVLKVLPGVGAAISGIEAYDQFKKGNYGQALGRAALGVIGLGSLIPGLGLIPAAISLGGNLAMDMFTEQPTTYYRNLLIEEIVNIKNKGTMTKGEISDRDRLAKRVKAKAIKGKDTEQNAQYRLSTHITLKNRKEGSSKKTKRSSKGNNKSKK